MYTNPIYDIPRERAPEVAAMFQQSDSGISYITLLIVLICALVIGIKLGAWKSKRDEEESDLKELRRLKKKGQWPASSEKEAKPPVEVVDNDPPLVRPAPAVAAAPLEPAEPSSPVASEVLVERSEAKHQDDLEEPNYVDLSMGGLPEPPLERL